MSGSRSAQLESKREEFRKYLENEGVLEYLTKSLVSLYEADRPKSALDYLKNNFSGKEQEVLQLKVDNLTKENDILSKRNQELQQKVEELEKEKADLELKVSASSMDADNDKDSAKVDKLVSQKSEVNNDDKVDKGSAAEGEPMDTTPVGTEDSSVSTTNPEKTESATRGEQPGPDPEKAKAPVEEPKAAPEAPVEAKATD